MKTKRYAIEQKIRILRDAERADKTIVDVCREKGITEQTFYRWKKEFGMVLLDQATRVILDHGGQTHRFKAKIKPLVIMMILVIAALATRMIAGILPQIRVSHQVYAAILWIAAILTWAIKILPGVLQTGDDPQ
jgi:hypothetical protein